jgi:vacuolar-type H+-ATPase subunit E/Vma4
MTVEKKIQAFEQMAVKAAEDKKKQAASDMAARFKSSVEDELRAEIQKAREKVQSERYLTERKKNKQIVDASGKAKREFIEYREKLTEELFGDVLTDLKAFAASAEYEAFLLDRIQGAAGSGRYEAVQLRLDDMLFATTVEAATGLRVEEAPEDFIGGFRLIGEGRRSVSDRTLAGQLAVQRENFSLIANEGLE